MAAHTREGITRRDGVGDRSFRRRAGFRTFRKRPKAAWIGSGFSPDSLHRRRKACGTHPGCSDRYWKSCHRDSRGHHAGMVGAVKRGQVLCRDDHSGAGNRSDGPCPAQRYLPGRVRLACRTRRPRLNRGGLGTLHRSTEAEGISVVGSSRGGDMPSAAHRDSPIAEIYTMGFCISLPAFGRAHEFLYRPHDVRVCPPEIPWMAPGVYRPELCQHTPEELGRIVRCHPPRLQPTDRRSSVLLHICDTDPRRADCGSAP